MNLRRILTPLAVALGSIALSVGLQTFAFTQPAASPPDSDAYAPLNTSPAIQIKEGGLILGSGMPTASLQTLTGIQIRSGGLIVANANPLTAMPSGNAYFSGHITIGFPSDDQTTVDQYIRLMNPSAFLDINMGTAGGIMQGVHVGNLAPAGFGAFETNFDSPAASFIANEDGSTVFSVIGGGTGYFKSNVSANDFCLNDDPTKCLSAVGAATGGFDSRYQKRVTGQCLNGSSAISAIGVTGTVSCQPIVSGFGNWQSLIVNKTYTASSDGFVLSNNQELSNQNCVSTIETPVGTTRQYDHAANDGMQSSQMSPVKAGDSWRVSVWGSDCAGPGRGEVKVYWIPLM